MTTGLVLLTGSLLIFGTLGTGSDFWNILPGLLLGGLGMAITMAPTTSAAMSAVPRDKAGVGSAVINSMRQVGGSLGVAIMGTLVASQITVSALNPAFPSQFVDGYHNALHVGAAFVLLGAVVAWFTIKVEPHPHPAVGTPERVPEPEKVEVA
jgi:MFS family permease